MSRVLTPLEAALSACFYAVIAAQDEAQRAGKSSLSDDLGMLSIELLRMGSAELNGKRWRSTRDPMCP